MMSSPGSTSREGYAALEDDDAEVINLFLWFRARTEHFVSMLGLAESVGG